MRFFLYTLGLCASAVLPRATPRLTRARARHEVNGPNGAIPLLTPVKSASCLFPNIVVENSEDDALPYAAVQSEEELLVDEMARRMQAQNALAQANALAECAQASAAAAAAQEAAARVAAPTRVTTNKKRKAVQEARTAEEEAREAALAELKQKERDGTDALAAFAVACILAGLSCSAPGARRTRGRRLPLLQL